MGNYVYSLSFILFFAFASLSFVIFDLNGGKRPPKGRAPPPLTPPAQPQIQPTYFTWVLQWPNSFCYNADSSKRCSLNQPGLPSFFTIHGLWPKLNTCTEEEFDVLQIETIVQNKLRVRMPNLKWFYWESHTQLFWKAQWEKHGTCLGLSQKAYFRMIYKVNNLIDLPKDINKNYGPGTKFYSAEDFQKQIAAKIRVEPTIKCNKSPDKSYDQILEVKLNVTLTGYFQPLLNPELTDCPATGPVWLR